MKRAFLKRLRIYLQSNKLRKCFMKWIEVVVTNNDAAEAVSETDEHGRKRH